MNLFSKTLSSKYLFLKNKINTFYETDRKWLWLSLTLICTVITLSFVNYLNISKQSDLNESAISHFGLLYINLGFLLFILVISGWRWFSIIKKEQGHFAAYKLQKQIVVLFGFVTLIPGIFVAIFASLFFNLVVQAWFGEPVKNVLLETDKVVQAYIKEYRKTLGFEAQNIAAFIQPKLRALLDDPEAFNALLTDLEDKLHFNEALILNSKQSIFAKSYLTFSLELSPIHPKDFKKARNLEAATHIHADQLRALVLLDEQEDLYLYIGKSIDKKILHHIQHHDDALSLYQNLEKQRSGFEITFLMIFALITLLLLVTAIWFGINIANRLVRPVSQLVLAAQSVSQGNLDIYVEPQQFNNELDTLVQSFNTMTDRLKQQQKEIILNQKKATWSDIARKIAHEIKNPLTPIQLSAERLKRRYLKQIPQGKEIFEQCIDTIIRQVKHIELLVREFSSFARMPEAIMETADLLDVLKKTIDFEAQAHSEIRFIENFPHKEFFFRCDNQQITQVFMNILQNSINNLIENLIENPTIKVSFFEEETQFFLTIADNGTGFPKIGREKLTEPYYTTREKGTGLGLSIVEKIVVEHGGIINFSDSNMGGALVTIIFNKKE